MTRSALISLVIPTRNRAAHLRNSLRCALAQAFDDYEIIVSDNDSQDDTSAVVSEFSDPRVKYFRTNASLSMPESWEFALSKASGQYITYLSDDDAIVP